MAVRYKLADVRFNNGNGALLCNCCSIIIDYGFEHDDEFHFCEKCEPKKGEWALKELRNQLKVYSEN